MLMKTNDLNSPILHASVLSSCRGQIGAAVGVFFRCLFVHIATQARLLGRDHVTVLEFGAAGDDFADFVPERGRYTKSLALPAGNYYAGSDTFSHG